MPRAVPSPARSPAPSGSRPGPGRRRRWGVVAGAVILGALAGPGLLGGCARLEPVPPPVPEAGSFDIDTARATLAQARAAETAGALAEAQRLYHRAADLWPTLAEAWQGAARVARARGDTPGAQRAAFFADRVADYDALHPRQARLAFAAVARDAEAAAPAPQPAVDAADAGGAGGLGAEDPVRAAWAARLVAFFAYKDQAMTAEDFAARPPRSWIERTALYPVAAVSMGAFAYSLGSAVGGFDSD